MSFVDDVAQDYLIFDGTETVTVKLKRSTYGANNYDRTIPIATALRNGTFRIEQLFGQSFLRGDEVLWSIPVVELTATHSDAVIREADEIIDSCGTVYQVLRVAHKVWQTSHVCICRKNREDG